MGKIIVAGSSNIDMTAYVKTLPRPGETIGNGRFLQANGGKGANQAVAAARLGGDVVFLTCVGDDMQGRMLKEVFASDGIHTEYMKFSSTSPTGTALIFVADDGENCIAVAPGANGELLPGDIDEVAALLFGEREHGLGGTEGVDQVMGKLRLVAEEGVERDGAHQGEEVLVHFS